MSQQSDLHLLVAILQLAYSGELAAYAYADLELAHYADERTSQA